MSQPQSIPGADAVAVEFVETEWQQARASLRRARIMAVASVLFVTGYMTFLTVTLTRRLLEPKAAAAVTTQYISGFVQEHGAAFSQQIVCEVPRHIAHAPDYALAQLPRMRADLEQKLETILTEYCQALTPQLAELVNQFLTENQPAIQQFLAAGNDPAAFQQLGLRLEEHILVTFAQKNADGISANDRLAEGVAALRLAQEQLHRLAHAPDLTPDEKQLRRVLGLVLQQARRSGGTS